ncbi:MAG: uncharacterized protein QOF51_3261 [Chloroflexota bacterium]|nr:uncharacterized protein [Chloroflexota bacterium]
MGVREQLEADMKDAMRARDSERLTAIRMLRAAIQNEEIARTDADHEKHRQPMSEEDMQAVVEREVKQRRDSLDFARKANRDDLVQKEEAGLEIIEGYLPNRPLSRAEIEAEVRGLMPEVGAEFKKLMPAAAQRLRGRADGRLVNEVVRALTGG